MPRKKKSFDYNDTFPTRLRFLIDNRITQDQLAEKIGVTRQTIGNWCSGESSPDTVCLIKIAQHFNVSVDWLLFENAPQKIDATLSSVCNYTGLSEAAIKDIVSCKDYGSTVMQIFSKIISDSTISVLSLNLHKAEYLIDSAISNSESIMQNQSKTPKTLDEYTHFRLTRFDIIRTLTNYIDSYFLAKENKFLKRCQLYKKQVTIQMLSDLHLKDSELNGQHNETDE